MKKFEFLSGGRTVSGLAQMVAGTLWVKVDGDVFTFDGGRYEIDSTSSGAGGGAVVAPMPGKVTKINVSEGQEVKTGDVVVVMEAMKMEYTLKAEIDGKVASVGAGVGDQVGVNQLLVQVEAESAGE